MERILHVKDLPLMMNEIGKIKIGKKGKEKTSGAGNQYRAPEKLDHFVVTTTEKDANDDYVPDEEVMKLLGKKPTTIPIRLLFDKIELNFQTRYAMYNGKKLKCYGDGETWMWLDEKTGKYETGKEPTKQRDPNYKGKDKCKLNGVLSCMIDGSKTLGGVYKFRTTGFHSVTGILSALTMISSITGGKLKGIPLNLQLRPKQGKKPDGSPVKIWVVSIEYTGGVEQLQEQGLKLLVRDAEYNQRVKQIESAAYKIMSDTPDSFDENIADTISEFYPENMNGHPDGSGDGSGLEISDLKSDNGIADNSSEDDKNIVTPESSKKSTPQEVKPKKKDVKPREKPKKQEIEQAEVVDGDDNNTDDNQLEEEDSTPTVDQVIKSSVENPVIEVSDKQADKIDQILKGENPNEGKVKPEKLDKLLSEEHGFSEKMISSFCKKYAPTDGEKLKLLAEESQDELKKHIDHDKSEMVILIQGVIPGMIEDIEDEASRDDIRKYWNDIDQDNFKDVTDLFKSLKN